MTSLQCVLAVYGTPVLVVGGILGAMLLEWPRTKLDTVVGVYVVSAVVALAVVAWGAR